MKLDHEISVAEVRCITCGAEVGEPCTFEGRRRSWRTVHAARALAAIERQRELEAKERT